MRAVEVQTQAGQLEAREAGQESAVGVHLVADQDERQVLRLRQQRGFGDLIERGDDGALRVAEDGDRCAPREERPCGLAEHFKPLGHRGVQRQALHPGDGIEAFGGEHHLCDSARAVGLDVEIVHVGDVRAGRIRHAAGPHHQRAGGRSGAVGDGRFPAGVGERTERAVVPTVIAGATAAATGVSTLVVWARTAALGAARCTPAVASAGFALLCWAWDAESAGLSAQATADPLNAAAPSPRASANPPM